MPGLVMRDPTPGWLKDRSVVTGRTPESAYLAPWVWDVLRTVGGWIGADDPASQVMGLMTTGVPGSGRMTGGLADTPVGEKVTQKLIQLGDLVRGGVYSRVDRVAATLPVKGAHPNKVASLLKSGASQDEMAYRNVPQFLAGKGNAPVTRAELQAHLAQHPAPVPAVKVKGNVEALKAQSDVLQREINAVRDRAFANFDQFDPLTQANAPHWAIEAVGGGEFAASSRAKIDALPIPAAQKEAMLEFGRLKQQFRPVTEAILSGQPKYAQYQLPGGEQYRETLLTLPEQGEQGFQRLLAQRDAVDQEINAYHAARGDDRYAAHPPELVARYNALQTKIDAMQGQQFRSGHFDEPNLLVHTRSNERVLPTGERGRFLEEVQSDWHQQGKQKGYARDTSAELAQLASEWERVRRTALGAEGSERAAANARLGEITDQMNALHDLAGGVPDAPFKESWPDLGLKQQLLETAADPHAQWLGVTSGQTQAARYDLSKQVSQVRYDPQTHYLEAFDLGGERVIKQEGVRPEQLPEYIGKEPAERLLAQPLVDDPADQTIYHTLAGLDLQVGGEGMRHFYDQVLPKRLEKILKPFGGTVERGAVATAPPDVTTRYAGVPGHPFTAQQQEPAWIARLTPEMKARILKEGLPLLTVPLAALAARPAQPEAR